MIGIIDYGMGNLGSIKHKLDRINKLSFISADPKELIKADKLILPGVGNFSNAVKEIKNRHLWDVLNEATLVLKKPILGICLGMQLMAKRSEEGETEGFGWFDAEVIKFRINDILRFKVPHMGWNHVSLKKRSELFNRVDLDQGFYFVHSYHMKCSDDKDILNETLYEYSFVSAVQKENITGVQYHPEKSHEAGERFLKNFADL